MKITCPGCHSEIPLEDVNVATDIALCRVCKKNFSYSELMQDALDGPVDLMHPPKGAWFHRDGRGFCLGATTRSAGAFFLVPFMCVWSGFSLGGIYGTQIYHGKFNLGMSLFGIPFVLGTLFLGSMAVMSACGKVTLQVIGNEGTVFTGVGPIGWRRRFQWNEVTGIRRTIRYGNRGSSSEQITLEGTKKINFGSGINAERLEFILSALRQLQGKRF